MIVADLSGELADTVDTYETTVLPLDAGAPTRSSRILAAEVPVNVAYAEIPYAVMMLTPTFCSERTLVSPRRNHSSSWMIDLVCSFLVVSSGNPSPSGKRIW